MTPEEYYTQQVHRYRLKRKQIKRRRDFITLAKLLTFAGIIFQIYHLVTVGTIFFLYPAGAIVLFILLTLLDTQLTKQQQFTEELIRINTVEKNYLEGDLSAFLPGYDFAKPEHPYAEDLDLFGEDSLFQHLNRTVTANGTRKLVSWLLSLSKNPDTIRRRQEAVAELSALPEQCQYFRALGKLHPTTEIDLPVIRKWQQGSPFFRNPRSIRLGLYTANLFTLTAWLLTIAGMIPLPLSLSLSFVQLFVLSLYLKKINRYHRELNLFLRTISNSLPLVRLIHKQNFTSPYLRYLRETLSDKNNNALQALGRLNKIQENLDQRGNILAAFVLNGLYLRDLHIILKLDRWKNRYSSFIPTWIETVSETDALISMANYRYNHPHYTFPLLNDRILLEAKAIGHPLLKSGKSVTNDFRMESLHQLFIVTGANMAGKSTFLRTIGLNLVLAQSGNVVCSTRFTFQPMGLFSSMRTTDNLSKETSYFHAELLRLKQLITTAGQEERMFIILDEMLKGTNSVDKLNGSLAFLRKLLNYPIAGLIATHDLALGELAHTYPENFFNVCFEITHAGNEIHYDYKLHPGISSTMNATILLKQMGLI